MSVSFDGVRDGRMNALFGREAKRDLLVLAKG
jgi:hypothetical protein